jgi:hypothetical protein
MRVLTVVTFFCANRLLSAHFEQSSEHGGYFLYYCAKGPKLVLPHVAVDLSSLERSAEGINTVAELVWQKLAPACGEKSVHLFSDASRAALAPLGKVLKHVGEDSVVFEHVMSAVCVDLAFSVSAPAHAQSADDEHIVQPQHIVVDARRSGLQAALTALLRDGELKPLDVPCSVLRPERSQLQEGCSVSTDLYHLALLSSSGVTGRVETTSHAPCDNNSSIEQKLFSHGQVYAEAPRLSLTSMGKQVVSFYDVPIAKVLSHQIPNTMDQRTAVLGQIAASVTAKRSDVHAVANTWLQKCTGALRFELCTTSPADCVAALKGLLLVAEPSMVLVDAAHYSEWVCSQADTLCEELLQQVNYIRKACTRAIFVVCECLASTLRYVFWHAQRSVLCSQNIAHARTWTVVFASITH